MTLTITFAGVLTFLMAAAIVILILDRLRLDARLREIEGDQNRHSDNHKWLRDRVDGYRDEVRRAVARVDKIENMFLPTVTAWAANQNTPKSEG